jgi:opacity protein-like surface antigen
MHKIVAVLLICIVFSSNLLAAYNFNNVYVGGGFGQSFIDTSTEGQDGKRLRSVEFEAYLGYRFNSNLRWDLQYVINDKREISQNYYYKSNAIFANLYFDLWDVSSSFLTPFIGAGIGLGSPAIEWSSLEYKKSDFAWQAQGGLHIKIFPLTILTFKYSYTAMPSVQDVFDSKDVDSNTQSISVNLSILI